jgi:hypothetical protein
MIMNMFKCKVLNVVDGDTLDLELDLGFNIRIIERIRLVVDVVENFGPNAEPAGRNATEFVKNWISTREAINGGTFLYKTNNSDYSVANISAGRSMGDLVFNNPVTGQLENLSDALINKNFVRK